MRTLRVMEKELLKMKQANNRPAIILGMTANGLSVARSLGRKGIPVIGIDSNRRQPGMFSRYCKHLVCPNVIEKEDDFLDFLINFCQYRF